MTLKEIQAFISVYENQSISKAAERLYVPQPSLTRLIQKIENDAGAELFKRTRDGLKPTVAGEIYMQTAEKMLSLYRQLDEALFKASSDNRGKLIVGTTFFLGSIVLPPVVAEFAKAYPNVEITVIEGTSTEIQNEIGRGLVDIGIIHLPVNMNGLDVLVIGQERFLLAVSPDDAINAMAYEKDEMQLPYVDLRLMAKRPFIMTHPNQRARQEAQRICLEAGFEPTVKFATRNLQTVSRLVHQGIGVSLIPSSYITLFSENEAPSYYNIEEEFHPQWPLAVICSKNLARPAAFQEFINICTEVLPTIYNF